MYYIKINKAIVPEIYHYNRLWAYTTRKIKTIMARSSYHIEPLNKENFDTWSVQAQAVFIKNKLWVYVDGTIQKPENDPVTKAKYEEQDLLSRSELLLLMSPSELKQVKNCKNSKKVWDILKATYQSKGPARKATLLKQVISKK